MHVYIQINLNGENCPFVDKTKSDSLSPNIISTIPKLLEKICWIKHSTEITVTRYVDKVLLDIDDK